MSKGLLLLLALAVGSVPVGCDEYVIDPENPRDYVSESAINGTYSGAVVTAESEDTLDGTLSLSFASKAGSTLEGSYELVGTFTHGAQEFPIESTGTIDGSIGPALGAYYVNLRLIPGDCPRRISTWSATYSKTYSTLWVFGNLATYFRSTCGVIRDFADVSITLR